MTDVCPTEHHPAADLMPPMSDEEMQTLVDDIRESGLLQPIVLHEGRILDGRHRARACREVGVEPRFVEWDGSGGSPLGYVIASNVHRRHLTAGQRAALAVELLPALEVEARERMAAGGRGDRIDTPSKGKSRARAAKAVGVSEGYVAQAKWLADHSPDLLEAVRDGTVTLPKAVKIGHRERERERKAEGGGEELPEHDWREHWRGMPEYVHEDLSPHKTLRVHFASERDMKAFGRLLGQNVGEKTRSLWYPKAEIGRYKNLAFVSGGRGDAGVYMEQGIQRFDWRRLDPPPDRRSGWCSWCGSELPAAPGFVALYPISTADFDPGRGYACTFRQREQLAFLVVAREDLPSTIAGRPSFMVCGSSRACGALMDAFLEGTGLRRAPTERAVISSRE